MKKTILEGDFSQEGKPLTDEQQSLSVKAPYEAPVITRTLVETEGSFCGSVFEEGEDQKSDITIQEHGFANPNVEWEGDYTVGTENGGWDE